VAGPAAAPVALQFVLLAATRLAVETGFAHPGRRGAGMLAVLGEAAHAPMALSLRLAAPCYLNKINNNMLFI